MANQQTRTPRPLDSYTPAEQIELLKKIRDILVDELCAALLGEKSPLLAQDKPVVDDFTAEAMQEAEAILS